jgi:hypothetical protein
MYYLCWSPVSLTLADAVFAAGVNTINANPGKRCDHVTTDVVDTGGLRIFSRIKINRNYTTGIRVPDPDWIRIQSGQWMRIRIRNPDPDPGGQK